MTIGIRAFCNAKFVELLPQFHSGAMDSTQFRAAVRQAVMEQFPKVSGASASTHYNFSFNQQLIHDPRSVKGLGRPDEKNNGGREVLHPVTLIRVKDGKVVAAGISRTEAVIRIQRADRIKGAKLMIKDETPTETVPAE